MPESGWCSSSFLAFYIYENVFGFNKTVQLNQIGSLLRRKGFTDDTGVYFCEVFDFYEVFFSCFLYYGILALSDLRVLLVVTENFATFRKVCQF